MIPWSLAQTIYRSAWYLYCIRSALTRVLYVSHTFLHLHTACNIWICLRVAIWRPPNFNLPFTHSRLKHLADSRDICSQWWQQQRPRYQLSPPEVHRAQKTLMFHIVQTLCPVLFSQQINRSGVELEPCSTLTSKHHNLFMRLLLDCKMFCASCGWSMHIFSFLINGSTCIHRIHTQDGCNI